MNCEVYSSLVGFYRIIRVLIKSCAETTHSISDADPSMLSKHADIYRPPHYNTTPALNTLTELSRPLYPTLRFPYSLLLMLLLSGRPAK